MNLIYTQRHWLPRLIDITVTLIAWAAFAGLLYIGFMGLMADQRQGLHIDMGALMLFGMESLLFYLALSLSMASVLSIWAAYREKQAAGFKRRKRVPIMSDQALSDSFRVDHRLLQLVQEQQVLTVHNDEQGHFLAVDMPGLEQRYLALDPPVEPEVVMISVDNATHRWQTFNKTHGSESLVSMRKADVINGYSRH